MDEWAGHVEGNASDVVAMTNPRTSATDEPSSRPEPVQPPQQERNGLIKLQETEPFLCLDDFRTKIAPDKMIHVITDSGSQLNPGNAGWGAPTRQNQKCTWFHEHYNHATNNAMELRAGIEALAILPDKMHVLTSTDLAYVKKGITEWMGNWVQHRETSRGMPLWPLRGSRPACR
jgi:hypothetical protein